MNATLCLVFDDPEAKMYLPIVEDPVYWTADRDGTIVRIDVIAGDDEVMVLSSMVEVETKRGKPLAIQLRELGAALSFDSRPCPDCTTGMSYAEIAEEIVCRVLRETCPTCNSSRFIPAGHVTPRERADILANMGALIEDLDAA